MLFYLYIGGLIFFSMGKMGKKSTFRVKTSSVNVIFVERIFQNPFFPTKGYNIIQNNVSFCYFSNHETF